MGFNEQDGAEFYPIDELQSKSSKRQFLGVDIDSIISSNNNFSMNTKLFQSNQKGDCRTDLMQFRLILILPLSSTCRSEEEDY